MKQTRTRWRSALIDCIELLEFTLEDPGWNVRTGREYQLLVMAKDLVTIVLNDSYPPKVKP